MSHTVKQKSQCTNLDVIRRAVSRIPGATVLGYQSVRFYSDSAKGLAIQLPGFRYPIVVDEITGEIKSDTYNGNWGNTEKIKDFQQLYALEAGHMDAEAKGYETEEIKLDNGDIMLRIHVGEASSFGSDPLSDSPF